MAAKVRAEVDEEGGLKTESIKDIATATSPKAGALEAKFRADLELEIKKSAAIRANAASADVLAKFQTRLIKLRWDRVNALAKEAENGAAAAISFQKTNPKLAKEQLTIAVDRSIEMSTIVDDYNAAYKKNESFLKQNPDHDTIFKFVSGLTTIANRVLKNVATAQSTVK